MPFETFILLKETESFEFEILDFIFSLPKILTKVFFLDHLIKDFYHFANIFQHFADLNFHDGQQLSLMYTHTLIQCGLKIVKGERYIRIVWMNSLNIALGLTIFRIQTKLYSRELSISRRKDLGSWFLFVIQGQWWEVGEHVEINSNLNTISLLIIAPQTS